MLCMKSSKTGWQSELGSSTCKLNELLLVKSKLLLNINCFVFFLFFFCPLPRLVSSLPPGFGLGKHEQALTQPKDTVLSFVIFHISLGLCNVAITDKSTSYIVRLWQLINGWFPYLCISPINQVRGSSSNFVLILKRYYPPLLSLKLLPLMFWPILLLVSKLVDRLSSNIYHVET